MTFWKKVSSNQDLSRWISSWWPWLDFIIICGVLLIARRSLIHFWAFPLTHWNWKKLTIIYLHWPINTDFEMKKTKNTIHVRNFYLKNICSLFSSWGLRCSQRCQSCIDWWTWWWCTLAAWNRWRRLDSPEQILQ